MHKAIKNDKSKVIHAAYNVHAPASLCGGLDPWSEKMTVLRFVSVSTRNAAVTCKRCLKTLGLLNPPVLIIKEMPSGTMNVLTACVDNIKENITTFVLNSLECEHMITDMMETTSKCRNIGNTVRICEWVFCPLRREI
jgi:hypothetical protein